MQKKNNTKKVPTMQNIQKIIAEDLAYCLGWTIDLSNHKRPSVIVFDHTSYWDFWIVFLGKMFPEAANMYILVQPKAFDLLKAYVPFLINALKLVRAGSIHEYNSGSLKEIVQHLQQATYSGGAANAQTTGETNGAAAKSLIISPKGTIQKKQWRSGYIYLAKQLGLSIQPLLINWTAKTVVLGSHLYDPDDTLLQQRLQIEFSKGVPIVPENSDDFSNYANYDPYECPLFDCTLLSNLCLLPIAYKLWTYNTVVSQALVLFQCLTFIISWKYHASREMKYQALDRNMASSCFVATVAYAMCNLSPELHSFSYFQAKASIVLSCCALATVTFVLGVLTNKQFRPRIRGIYSVFHCMFHISTAILLYTIL